MNTGRQAPRPQAPKHKSEIQYDIASFARKHGLTAVKAKDILERAGDSRAYADLLATRGKPVDTREF